MSPTLVRWRKEEHPMKTSKVIKQARQELSGVAMRLEILSNAKTCISSYKDLALDLARVCCRVSCAIDNRDEKGITQIKWRQHHRELKRALKEQHEITVQIFNNEVE